MSPYMDIHLLLINHVLCQMVLVSMIFKKEMHHSSRLVYLRWGGGGGGGENRSSINEFCVVL